MKKIIKNRKLRLVIIFTIIIITLIIIFMYFLPKGLVYNLKDTDVEKIILNLEGAYSPCLVTENNDPNGKLNKKGGYTGAVYFRLKQVDQKVESDATKEFGEDFVNSEYWSNIYDDYNNSCEAGTSGGGQIEIYSNVSDAQKRNEYLSKLDGFLSGGYHIVNKNLVIRISDELTANQQKEVANKINELLNKYN